MKQLIPFLLIILLTATIAPSFKAQPPHEKVVVNEQLEPFFDRFVELMAKNDIPVDYSLLTTVDLLPLYYGVQGIYSPTTKGVVINYYIQFPVLQKLTRAEKDDFIFIVLAHEIGHAMGWKHIDAEAIGLMNPSSKHDLSIIRGSLGADQYIINTYKAKFCK